MSESKKISNNSFEDAIKQSSSKQNIYLDFGKTWIAYVVLAVLIVGSILVRTVVHSRVESELAAEFEKCYSSVTTRLNSEYDKLYQVVQSTQGLYYQNVQVVRDIFELTGTVPVNNFTSILCITYAPKVTNGYYSQYIYEALSEGYRTYSIHPDVKRDYYYPVEHIVDFEKQPARVGFDYASLPELKDAIELACKDNIITSTEFFNLRPDTLSFAIISPIWEQEAFRNNKIDSEKDFLGSVVMEIDAASYFRAALNGGDNIVEDAGSKFATDSSITFTIVDVNSSGKEIVVFSSSNIDKADASPIMTVDCDLQIANRHITVKFATAPDFGGNMQANLPNIVLLVALLLSLLAFFLIMTLLTQKAKAEEIAEKMTASQRRILETSRDIIAVLSAEGVWLSMNPASKSLLGLLPEKVVGTNIADYLYNAKDISLWQKVVDSKEEHNRIDLQVKSDNERGFVWASWSFTKPANENLVYAIGRDVTLEKEAEVEIKFRAKQTDLANCYEQEAAISKVHLMIQLSHEMRNQLTSMMGYLQLITSGAFDNDEELQTYAGSAYESAENAYSFIHDMSEATIGDSDTLSKVAMHKIEDTIVPVISKFKDDKRNVNIEFAEHGKDSHIIVDVNILGEVWYKLFRILTGVDNNTIKFTANENKLEGVTEIVIEANSYPELATLTDVYNAAPSKVIDNLRDDIDDILIDIAKVSSFIARMMGTFNIESMDDGRTAYFFIALPLVLRINQD
jgi:PAS domain S-box-containing protein